MLFRCFGKKERRSLFFFAAKNSRGFSILEVMISFTILSLVILTMVNLCSNSLGDTRESSLRLLAFSKLIAEKELPSQHRGDTAMAADCPFPGGRCTRVLEKFTICWRGKCLAL